MQEQFIGRAAHGPASKHPTLPLSFCINHLDQCSFLYLVGSYFERLSLPLALAQ
jgi:hypothetical protein